MQQNKAFTPFTAASNLCSGFSSGRSQYSRCFLRNYDLTKVRHVLIELPQIYSDGHRQMSGMRRQQLSSPPTSLNHKSLKLDGTSKKKLQLWEHSSLASASLAEQSIEREFQGPPKRSSVLSLSLQSFPSSHPCYYHPILYSVLQPVSLTAAAN